jgi:membrane protein required for colicin V production
MNWLDAVIVLVLVGFVASAYSAGLIREVVTLIASLVGVIVAGLLYDDLANDVLVFLDSEGAARAVAFLVLFASVYLIGQIIAYVLKTGAQLLMLGWADRLGGAVFGLIKGLVVVQVLLIVFAAFPSLGLDGAVGGSEIAPFFIDDASLLLNILPGEFNDRIADFLSPEDALAGPGSARD